MSKQPRYLSILTGFILSVVCLSPASAAEGMWPLNNLPLTDMQARYGFTPDKAWTKKVMKASVRLTSGCSGSFVSPDGLIMTNYHCVAQCVSQLSTEKNNLSAKGFLARQKSQELKCPEIEINQLEKISDVTKRVRKATQQRVGAAYAAEKQREIARIETECAGGSKTKRCEVVDLYQGGQQHLYEYLRYPDVRLVWAPEYDTGFFGGDPDNFNFPRFNLDAAFLRAYSNGVAVENAEYFPLNAEGAKKGELVMITGHPGSTQRLLTVSQLITQRDVDVTSRLLYLAELRGLLIQYRSLNAEAARVARTDLTYTENSYKALRGRLQALLDPQVIEYKQQQESQLRNVADSELAWRNIEKAQINYRNIETALKMIECEPPSCSANSYPRALLSPLYRIARHLVRGAAEREKQDGDRLPEYTESSRQQLEQLLFSSAPIYPEYEQVKLSWSLGKLREELGVSDPIVSLVLGRKSPEVVARNIVDGTKLGSVAERKRLWEGGVKAIEASKDPMIVLARALDEPGRALRSQWQDTVQAVEKRNAAKIADIRFSQFGTSIYPDATFSLRLSYGEVKGWEEKGKTVLPVTRVKGLYLRDSGQSPYALPDSWKQAKDAIDQETKMNFVSSNDIIGGNSGSPVINQKAEVVGLVFDGNIHSLGGAYWYDERLNRAVSVHSAVILEALDKVYGANELVSELTDEAPSTKPAQ